MVACGWKLYQQNQQIYICSDNYNASTVGDQSMAVHTISVSASAAAYFTWILALSMWSANARINLAFFFEEALLTNGYGHIFYEMNVRRLHFHCPSLFLHTFCARAIAVSIEVT